MKFVDCSCSSNYLNADCCCARFSPFFPLQELAAAQPARLSLAARTRSQLATQVFQAGTSWRMMGGQQQLCIKCLQSLARFVHQVANCVRFAFVKSTRINVMQLPHGMGRPVVSPVICHTAQRFQAGCGLVLHMQAKMGGAHPFPPANPMVAAWQTPCRPSYLFPALLCAVSPLQQP